ncbi:HTH domain-containing protein [Sulfolobus sp. S-194]|uniref:helix-turn-helix domain-containing protein n=1 Tax=Sulfolobus sp. S-194 TaxID=2512240 RepID=UPI00143710CC|nr:helix-turn-helix domain-containing protein [Sulfolobus sp. S-194]QIW23938.1 HTH domain-containing protein [Sulfolobus sp. S-194]
MEKMEIPKELKPLTFIYDLNERELEIFLYLAKTKEQLNADELSEKLNISRSCIMGYIKKLENKGLILKKRDVRTIRRGKPQYLYYVDNTKVREKIVNDIIELAVEVRKSFINYLNDLTATAWPIKKSSENGTLPRSTRSNIEIEQSNEA